MANRILVVDDNSDIRENICEYLNLRGHQTIGASDAASAAQLIAEEDIALIVLDVGLPGEDGMSFCRRLRLAGSSILILMLTARDAVDDRVAGLESGADDYVIKPFSLLELNARVEALLRRAGRSGMTAGASKKLQVGPLVLDPDALSVEREGKSLRLNPTCFRILTVLMRASPRVVSREELESKVWSDGAPISVSLRSNLYLLRQALDKPFNVPMLKTHPGAGWSVCSPDGVKG